MFGRANRADTANALWQKICEENFSNYQKAIAELNEKIAKINSHNYQTAISEPNKKIVKLNKKVIRLNKTVKTLEKKVAEYSPQPVQNKVETT